MNHEEHVEQLTEDVLAGGLSMGDAAALSHSPA